MATHTLSKIISGGQTGGDQAALRAALECGLAVGGWCPPGRVCEAGVIPPQFPLTETPEDRSPDAPQIPRSQRTQWNVRDADATLIIRRSREATQDPGTAWAQRCAARFVKPLLVVDPTDPRAGDQVARWIESLPIETLNVAGPSESTEPGIGDETYSLLTRVLPKNSGS